MKFLSAHHKKQQGAAVVEFAIILPVFMLILLAVVDLGTALYDYAILTNASREGARWGIIASNNPNGNAWNCSSSATDPIDPCGVANQKLNDLLISYSGENLPVTTASGGGVPGDTVTVTSNYVFNGIGLLALKNLTLSATTRMNYE